MKYCGYLSVSLLAVGCLYLMNLFSTKPYSLDHFLAKELIVSLTESPEYMTYLGLFDNFDFVTKHNQKLSIPSAERSKENYENNVEKLKIIKGFNVNTLEQDQRITQKIALFDTQNDIERYERFKYHSYPFNQISGNHLNLVEFMTDTHPLKSRTDAENYIERVQMFDEVLEANLLWLEEQKRQNIYAPKFVFDHVIKQLNELINYDDSENPLMVIFKNKVNKLNLKTEETDRLTKELSKVISEDVKPGFQLILSFMESNYEMANKYHGVWSLPDGDDYYALRLRSYTTTDYSAEEIHQLGLQEVDRIGKRMKEIFLELGYKVDKPVGEMMNDLNEDPNFLYEDTEDRKKIVIDDYNQMVKEAEEDVRPYFHKFPSSPVEVRPVPEYSEKTAAGGYYQSPSLDGSRPGVFYANLYDIKHTPKYGMRTLTFHEAVPGQGEDDPPLQR